jgi:hypothetical protein
MPLIKSDMDGPNSIGQLGRSRKYDADRQAIECNLT